MLSLAAGVGGVFAGPATNEIRLVEIQGVVEVSPSATADWLLAQTNQILKPAYRLRTGANSRATMRWSDQSVIPFGPLTELEILPANGTGTESGLHLIRGIISFFHRDKPGRIRVLTRGAFAGIEGTEFVMEAAGPDAERTTLSVIDGRVRFGNDAAALILTNGEQAVATPGRAPVRTAGFIASNLLQWCLYYPGVLDLNDLPLTAEEASALTNSLASYRAGDLLAALDNYPADRKPGSDAERIYHAALLLSVGQVEQAQPNLAALTATGASEKNQRLATALRTLIAAVKRGTRPASLNRPRSTELLAASYYEQSCAGRGGSLDEALHLARQAVADSPEFGFGWERVAELEFSFGRTDRAFEALYWALTFAPRNAQALALKGFLLAAQNQTRAAITWFDRALAVDSALGNAWLGRGLCRIRDGDAAGGREDLLIAAALEPQRAALRSYLGKAFSSAGQMDRAVLEMKRAQALDPNDPTPWLYSALVKRDQNEINGAVADLEKSIDLNDNRAVYRSRFLLDEDRAVRSANLASVYRDAGMTEVSVSEAGSAVTRDYGNFSAHLFLANSYNELRDPNLINLRYESATFSEYLVANLLSPVGGSKLSPYVSQQEYSGLFERQRTGFSSESTYLSGGDWQQQASLYGWQKNTSYAADVYYRSQNGERINNDLEQRAVSVQLKQQLSQQDSVYLQAVVSDFGSGDVRQLHDQRSADSNLRANDRQVPNLFLGYHHEWAQGIHTLLLAGRLDDHFSLSTTDVTIPGVIRNSSGAVVGRVAGLLGAGNETFDALQLGGSFEAYSAELQQIAQVSRHTLVVGTRYQAGETRTESDQTRLNSGRFPPYSSGNYTAAQSAASDLTRLSFYGYDQWQVFDPLWLTIGASYDRLHYPDNVELPPVSNADRTASRISPKAGFVWTPAKDTTVRGAFTRSLGGLFYDASVRLEPVQIAGFNQAYRSLIPESVEGAVPGSKFQTFNLGFEQKFKSRTYLVLQLELLQSEVARSVGAFNFDPSGLTDATPTQLRQTLTYEERSLLLSLNQLMGRDWACGARYQISDADLKTSLPELPQTLFPDGHKRAVLHTLDLHLMFNHPSGFFAEAQALWRGQSNYHDDANLAGDNFWQFNLFTGYRFPRRRAELTVGLLNLAGQDYQLNPLNLHQELPHERTLLVSLKLNF